LKLSPATIGIIAKTQNKQNLLQRNVEPKYPLNLSPFSLSDGIINHYQ